MAKDLTMSVDDQMLTCLEIMAHGEDMLAIGVWEAPVKRLAMKELAVQVGNGYRITDRGRAHLAKAEGVDVSEVEALAPNLPDWIVQPMDGMLVVLRKNDLTVSGYEAMLPAKWVPVVHGRMNDVDTAVLLGEQVDGFLQAMLDAAWARGLRPSAA
jgi:hypothetical protein